jgi:hypothetical protein
VRMVETLEQIQLVVDHTLIATDVLLQDNLDSHAPLGRFRFANDAICTSSKRLAKAVLGPVLGQRGIRSPAYPPHLIRATARSRL